MPTYEEAKGILSRVRVKYPVYNDLDDETLAGKLAAKFPQYADVAAALKTGGSSMARIGQVRNVAEMQLPGVTQLFGAGDTDAQNLLGTGITPANAMRFAAKHIEREAATRGGALSTGEQTAIQDIYKQAAGWQDLSSRDFLAEQRAFDLAKRRETLGGRLLDANSAYQQGVADIGLSLLGVVAPETAEQMRANVADVHAYDPESRAGKAGTLVAEGVKLGSTVSAMPATGIAALYGAQGFGSTRMDAERLRQQGQEVGLGQELATAGGVGLVEAASGYVGAKLFEGMGSALRAASPTVKAALAEGKKGAARALVRQGVTVLGGSLAEGAEEGVTQLVENKIVQLGMDPEQAVTEGITEAFLTGMILSPIGVGAANARMRGSAAKTRQTQQTQPPTQELTQQETQVAQPAPPAQPTPAAEAVAPPAQVRQAETPAQQSGQVLPPEPPADMIKRDLIPWAQEAGYDTMGFENIGVKRIRQNLAEQRNQPQAQETVAARLEARRRMTEQVQLPPESSGWDAGALRRFASEHGYEVDERRVQYMVERQGMRPRQAVRALIEEQYALRPGQGPAGTLVRRTGQQQAQEPQQPAQPQQGGAETAVEPQTAPEAVRPAEVKREALPRIPREARSWSFTKLKKWAKDNGYRVGVAENLGTLRRRINQQRGDAEIDLPRPPKSARRWTFKTLRYWAEQNGYDTNGVENRFMLQKAIKAQRSAALRQAREAGKPAQATPASQEVVSLQQQLEEERARSTRLETRLRTDEVTGKASKAAFNDDAAKVFAEADASGESVAVAFSDLGNFKVVNDELGHSVGNELLRAKAEALEEALRGEKGDRPADLKAHIGEGYRYGGDEFAAVLRGVSDPDVAKRVLQRASEIFDRKAAEIIGDKLPTEAYPFIAWGVEIRKPGDVRTAEQLLKAADEQVVPEKNRIKAERGIPEGRPELQAYIDRARAAAKTTNAAIARVTPIEGTAHKRRVPRFIEEFFTPIASRIRDLSPRLYDRLMRMEFDVSSVREDEKRRVAPHAARISEALGGPKTEQYRRFAKAVFNQDFDAARALLPESVHGDLQEITDTLERLHMLQESSGVRLGRLANYWPRYIRNYRAFDAVFGDDKGRFEEAWDLARAVKGRALLTAEEKADIANDVIQGYGPRKPGSYGPSHARERRIDQISDEQMPHYIDPFSAVMRYIDTASYAAGRSRFLGKNHTLANLDETIGKIVQEEVDAGHLNKESQEELRHLLQTRFTGDMLTMSKVGRNIKQLMYLATLGQVRSAVTQVTDMAATIVSHGLPSTGRGIRAALRLTPADRRLVMEDIGVHSHGEEFKDVGAMARATDRALRITGFTAMDRFGKETRINAAWSAFQKAAGKPDSAAFSEFEREYKPVFGDQFNQLVEDLKAGKKSESVRYAVFLDISKVQPITTSNMPERYLRMRNGRMMYAMKTFTIQQLDFLRRDAVRDLLARGRRRRGLEKFASYVLLVTLMGLGKDLLNDMLRGKEVAPDQVPDRAIDALLGITGINRYTVEKGWSEPSEAALNLISPPLSWVDATWEDVRNFGDGSGFRTIKHAPLVGDPWYYWFGKGSELKADEAKRDFRSKLADLREEAYYAHQAGDQEMTRLLLRVYNDRRKQGPGDGRNSPLTVEDLQFVPPSARDRKADTRLKRKAVEALSRGNMPEVRRLLQEYNRGRKRGLTVADLRKMEG